MSNEPDYKKLYEQQCAKIVDLYEMVEANFIYHASHCGNETSYHFHKEQSYELIMDKLKEEFIDLVKPKA
jgi:hypothetical protein